MNYNKIENSLATIFRSSFQIKRVIRCLYLLLECELLN